MQPRFAHAYSVSVTLSYRRWKHIKVLFKYKLARDFCVKHKQTSCTNKINADRKGCLGYFVQTLSWGFVVFYWILSGEYVTSYLLGIFINSICIHKYQRTDLAYLLIEKCIWSSCKFCRCSKDAPMKLYLGVAVCCILWVERFYFTQAGNISFWFIYWPEGWGHLILSHLPYHVAPKV